MNYLQKFLIITMITFLSSVGAHAAAVRFSPAPLIVSNGDSFYLELRGYDFNTGNLDGGGINIDFDPAVINVTGVTVNTAEWEFFSTDGTIDNTAGIVDGISFNSFQSRTGDLLFATIEFSAVGFGVSALGLSEYGSNPFATAGSFYPALTLDQSAFITVKAVPLPASIWLFLSGFGLLAAIRRRGQ